MGKREIKRIILCFISAVMIVIFFPFRCNAAGTESNAVENACRGVVRIFADYGDGRFGSGSGFGVGTAGQPTDIYVTNWHVVTDENGNPAKKVYILLSNEAVLCENGYISRIDEEKMVECEILYLTGGYPDVAILKAAQPIEDHIALPLMHAEDANRGDEICTLGFPASADVANSGYYYAEIDDVDMAGGMISKFFEFEIGGSTMAIQHHAHINHGNSGGPLVRKEDGVVIGINTYGYSDTTSNGSGEMEYSVSIYVDYAMVGLDELGIAYDIYDPYADTQRTAVESTEPESIAVIKEPEPKSSPVIWIAAGAVLLAAGAAVIVLLNRKKSGTDRTGGENKETEIQNRQLTSSAEPQGNRPQAVPAEPSGSRIQAQMPGQPVRKPQTAPAGQPQDSGIRLQGTGGAFAGRRFPLNGVVRIGRDPSKNDLVYPAGSPGISGAHCEIHTSNGQVFLRDPGSSYGTFLHGKKIPNDQMVPINIGETFCLGNPQESFMITKKSGR